MNESTVKPTTDKKPRKGYGHVRLSGVLHEFALVTWKDVIAVLGVDRERSSTATYVPALDRYRRAGFTPDDFARRVAAREAMADSLIRAEDHCEIEARPLTEEGDEARRLKRHHELDAERITIQEVRRRLEWELWP